MNAEEKTRLDRIEEKIDRMADAIIALARAEEKIANLSETTRITLKRLIDQEERMRRVEQSQSETESLLQTIKSVAWVFISTIITGLAGALMWVLGLGEN
tara:strand:- start:1380 stop:1679 length:300 start_codon:yes stop_codon:yes gene_type:complete